jgi:ribosome-binding factor A
VSGRIRPQRVGDLLRDELSSILSRDVEDPRVGLVTVTEVEMSPDLKVAKVFLSPVDPSADVRETIRVLERASGYIRKQLVRRRLPLRHLPELRFQHDDSIARGSRIDRLLDALRPEVSPDANPGDEEGEER